MPSQDNRDEDTRFRVLRSLESNPDLSQRDLAQKTGISLGALNYCLKGLVEKGYVKLGNVRRNPNKRQYAYLLTPKGMAEKAYLTRNFLNRRMREYEDLKAEIESLRQEQSTDAE